MNNRECGVNLWSPISGQYNQLGKYLTKSKLSIKFQAAMTNQID